MLLITSRLVFSSYRLCDPSMKHLYQSSPLFGVYFTVEKIGVLRVGDPVYQLVD